MIYLPIAPEHHHIPCMLETSYGVAKCVLSFSFGERKSSTSSQHSSPAFLINQHLHVQHIKCKAPLQNTVQLFNPSQGTPFLRGLDYISSSRPTESGNCFCWRLYLNLILNPFRLKDRKKHWNKIMHFISAFYLINIE